MSDILDSKSMDKLLSGLDQPTDFIKLVDRVQSCTALEVDDYYFFHVECLSHISDAPRREALENVYSCMRYPGANIVYVLSGDDKGVALYLGIARNYLYPESIIPVADIAKNILKPAFEGNFRGSVVNPIKGSTLPDRLKNYSHVAVLQGTVGDQQQGENIFFQGVDRLIDVMTGTEFCLVITAACIDAKETKILEKWLFRGYELLAPLARVAYQKGENTGDALSFGENVGKSSGTGTSENEGTSESTNESTSKSSSHSNTSESGTESRSSSASQGKSFSQSDSTSSGSNVGVSLNQGVTRNISSEIHNRQIQQWLAYLDEVLIPRVDYGRNRGGFVCNVSLLSNSRQSLFRLGDVTRAIFSGNTGNQYPLQMKEVSSSSEWVKCIKNFQVPVISRKSNDQTSIFDSLKSRVFLNGQVMLGAYATPKELSLMAGLPQQEVIGIQLREQVGFGLNPPLLPVINQLPLGSVVQDGRVLTKKVSLNRLDLNKHVFIAGVTGSGKTTTCHHLLRESMMPFLVIEPAKTEYRMLLDEYEDLLVLTPGRDELGPLRLNPLELMPEETISGRVDLIKASFAASFDMEAAIPQVLEAALYRCYEKMGWDLNTSKHPLYADPFAAGCYPFPILRDLLETTEQVVEEQGFDDRLRQDYIGSIKARLQGLLVGAKGRIFNTLRSIDFKELLNRRVVIELEEIRNGAEKSLLIAFIMTNVIQAIKTAHRKDSGFRHVTLIEEAHHLLSRSNSSASSNQRQAIEMFADMLAEVRKYGEGLIIVDQIPNKLTPEVLKNTNTKIVHKLFSEDDKVAIGNTIVLEKDQQQHLSRLGIGQAVVFSQGWHESVLTEIEVHSKTQADIPLKVIEPKLRERAWEFYQKRGNLHILPLQALQVTNSVEQWQERLSFSSDTRLLTLYSQYIEKVNQRDYERLRTLLEQAKNLLGNESLVVEHLLHYVYIPQESEPINMWREKLEVFYQLLMKNNGINFIRRENLHARNRRKY